MLDNIPFLRSQTHEPIIYAWCEELSLFDCSKATLFRHQGTVKFGVLLAEPIYNF